MEKRETLVFKEPQKKYNIKLDASSDFRLSSDTGWESQIGGKHFKLIPVSYLKYKFFYAPTTVLEIYFLSEGGELKPVYQNIYILLGKVKDLVLVRPEGMVSGILYFQFWLSNIESINISDHYETGEFDPIPSALESIELPFPTHQLRIWLKLNMNPTSINFQVLISNSCYDAINPYTLDYMPALAGNGLRINNYYEYNRIGGSEIETDPRHPFPSFFTEIRIENNDAGSSVTDVDVIVDSFGDK